MHKKFNFIVGPIHGDDTHQISEKNVFKYLSY